MKDAPCAGWQKPSLRTLLDLPTLQRAARPPATLVMFQSIFPFTFISRETKAIPVYDDKLRKYPDSPRSKLSCEMRQYRGLLGLKDKSYSMTPPRMLI